MIEGVDSILETMQKEANTNIDEEPSKYINTITTSYQKIIEAVAKGKTKASQLEYGSKNGYKVVETTQKQETPKEISQDAFFEGGLNQMFDINSDLEDR